MPAPSRDSGSTPPMTAPIAARPELPKNPRRLVSNVLPLAVLPPVSRAMTSLPSPAPGLSWPDFPSETQLRGVFALCSRAARPPAARAMKLQAVDDLVGREVAEGCYDQAQSGGSRRGGTSMALRTALFLAAALAGVAVVASTTGTAAAEPAGRITILYDAFGTDAAMKKDWGFSALVEITGKRILFDTGNDADIFAANVKAKGVDLTNLDLVVLSHRHSDHMAGLSYVLSVNPKVKIYAPKEGFGIYGSSLPSSFYRKDESLPPEMRYYGGKPPEIMKFGAAWGAAHFELI